MAGQDRLLGDPHCRCFNKSVLSTAVIVRLLSADPGVSADPGLKGGVPTT